MSLQDEINEKAKEIFTDSYPMSIGELMSIYKEGDLDIHPEFQRLFRWSEEQKSKLIESILLGIPIPSIFVSQRPDGIWDVIDGVQRLSTIFQFAGILKDDQKNTLDPLRLCKTEFLPSLENKLWQSPDAESSFTDDQRRFIKRSKLAINIVKKESDESAKYELFQRLNTGGSYLSPQEVRNCLMLMINPEFFRWLNTIREHSPSFKSCISLITSRAKEEQYDLELLSRLLIYRYSDLSTYKATQDIIPAIDDEIKALCFETPFDYEVEGQVIERTFSILDNALGEDVFRKYNFDKNKFEGPFSLSLFEAITPGVSKYIDKIEQLSGEELREKIKQISANPDFLTNFNTRGIRPIVRTRNLINLSTGFFSYEN